MVKTFGAESVSFNTGKVGLVAKANGIGLCSG
jgi:hypothetical protein